MKQDPFIHLPALRNRVTPPEMSELRVTPEVLAFWDRRARLMGRSDDWRLADHLREHTRRNVLGDLTSVRDDLWVYAYGSLMWDPGFHFSEIRLAELPGYQRRFTHRITIGRGSPERPALMLSIEPRAGCCRGLAFRIPAESVNAESEILWRREMIRGGYSPMMLAVTTPQGVIEALVFASNLEHPEYTGELSLGETATTIANASGPLGSNLAYLEQLAMQLSILEIEDDYVAHVLRHVRAVSGI